MKAELTADIDLREFPFDKHVLSIELGDRDALDVTYNVDKANVPPPTDISLAGWEITHGDATIETETLAEGLKDSKFVYSMEVRRPVNAAIAKNFLPAWTMVLVLFVSMFMKPKMAGARLAAGTGSFVGVIMFHNTAAGQLPPLGIFTRLDKFMFSLYVIWLVHIAISIAILRADEAKADARGITLYRVAWGLLPGIALIEWLAVFSRLV